MHMANHGRTRIAEEILLVLGSPTFNKQAESRVHETYVKLVKLTIHNGNKHKQDTGQ